MSAAPIRRATHRRRPSPSLARESSCQGGTGPLMRTEVRPAGLPMSCARGWCHRLQRSTHRTGQRRHTATTPGFRAPPADRPTASALRRCPRGRPADRCAPVPASVPDPRPNTQSAAQRRAWLRSAAGAAPTATASARGTEPAGRRRGGCAVARSPSGRGYARPGSPATPTPPGGPARSSNEGTDRGARDPRATGGCPAVPAGGSRVPPGGSGPTRRDSHLDSLVLLAAVSGC